MKQTLKATAAVIGIVAAGALTWYAVIELLWACASAGLPM